MTEKFAHRTLSVMFANATIYRFNRFPRMAALRKKADVQVSKQRLAALLIVL
jgi:hypothetical protein